MLLSPACHCAHCQIPSTAAGLDPPLKEIPRAPAVGLCLLKFCESDEDHRSVFVNLVVGLQFGLTTSCTMSNLPDPTVDLDWSGFVGPIHERFRLQAESNPDRICCIETKSSTTPERQFTYRQIYEASNVLAHYLHEAGITNGDVVMVWAYRSVDLVVGMMGVLVLLPLT